MGSFPVGRIWGFWSETPGLIQFRIFFHFFHSKCLCHPANQTLLSTPSRPIIQFLQVYFEPSKENNINCPVHSLHGQSPCTPPQELKSGWFVPFKGVIAMASKIEWGSKCNNPDPNTNRLILKSQINLHSSQELFVFHSQHQLKARNQAPLCRNQESVLPPTQRPATIHLARCIPPIVQRVKNSQLNKTESRSKTLVSERRNIEWTPSKPELMFDALRGYICNPTKRFESKDWRDVGPLGKRFQKSSTQVRWFGETVLGGAGLLSLVLVLRSCSLVYSQRFYLSSPVLIRLLVRRRSSMTLRKMRTGVG